MIICGVKLTHDGTIALIDNGKLIFSYEIEKISNNKRYSYYKLDLPSSIEIINSHGYNLSDIDSVVFDGWHNDPENKTFFEDFSLHEYGSWIKDGDDLLSEKSFYSNKYRYQGKSYKHVAGHALGAYCSSPFAKRGEDSYILVWDGGMFPQVFYYCHRPNEIRNIGNLFRMTSHVFADLAHCFEPFNTYESDVFTSPGKVMAFCGLGKFNENFFRTLQKVSFNSDSPLSSLVFDDRNIDVLPAFEKLGKSLNLSPPDISHTFQKFLGDLLVAKLKEVVDRDSGLTRNLCFSGGAALNINWNSAIRESKLFHDVWVPPFVNDSGSALGAACCEMVKYSSVRALDWDTYSGPKLQPSGMDSSWEQFECSLKQLAKLLHVYGEPVVFLNGNAELGPRALGNRSILAPASDLAMKHLLNLVKEREFYRPVAPICLEEDAPSVFTPGTPDPFMLFNHHVNEKWAKKIPAVCHVDGTARLQTVSSTQNPQVYELLLEYKKRSGLPLLCNTSANLNGCGFFPDVKSAMQWGKLNLVWSENRIFIKKGHSRFIYNWE